jgi:hypothetical protein
VLFKVSDGKLDDELELRLAVEAPETPPALEPIDDQVVAVGDTLRVTLVASDADGDPVTVSVRGGMPPGATFDAASATLAWTPGPEEAHRSYEVVLAVTDGRFIVLTTVRIRVEPAAARCSPDLYEPNDPPAAATPLAPGRYTGLNLCGLDIDRYAVDVLEGEVLSVRVAFRHADGDLDVFVSDADDTPIADGLSSDDDEEVTTPPLMQGTYSIAILTIGAAEVDYELVVEVLDAPVSCPDDEHDLVAGGNGDAISATSLAPGEYLSLTLCAGDMDWYRVGVAVGQRLSARIEFLGAEYDLDLYLLDGDGTMRLATATTSRAVESVSVDPVPAAGDYFVVVVGFEAAEGLYDLYIDVADATPRAVCVPDASEPNDGPDAAHPLVAELSDLTICAGDQDWFSIDLTAGASVVIFAFFPHATGDLDLYLYGPDDPTAPVASAESFDDDEELQLDPVAATGRYTVQVIGFRNAENTYSLLYEITPPPAPPEP